jgi:hypothetical protein
MPGGVEPIGPRSVRSRRVVVASRTSPDRRGSRRAKGACHARDNGPPPRRHARDRTSSSDRAVGFLRSRRNHHNTVPLEDKMATTNNANVTVKFAVNEKGNPTGKLCWPLSERLSRLRTISDQTLFQGRPTCFRRFGAAVRGGRRTPWRSTRTGDVARSVRASVHDPRVVLVLSESSPPLLAWISVAASWLFGDHLGHVDSHRYSSSTS